MKAKLLFAGLLSATCMSLQAQIEELEYHPFVEEGKVFKTQGYIKEDFTYTEIEGDTLINGETWKKVYNSMPWAGRLKHSYFAAVREEGKKVYAIAKGSDRPRLLYDFNMGFDEGSLDFVTCGIEGTDFGCLIDYWSGEKCDKLLGFNFLSKLLLEDIDTVRLDDGSVRRRFTFCLTDRNFATIMIADSIMWIEGLGSCSGPFSPWMPRIKMVEFDDEPLYNISYYLNGKLITDSSGFYDKDNEIPSAASRPKPAREQNGIYDLQGRSLPDKTERGIYIKDGRKVIAPPAPE